MCLCRGAYPYAFGICLTSLFAVFVLQLVLFRLGTEHLAKLGITQAPIPTVTEALAAAASQPTPAATATDLEQANALLPSTPPPASATSIDIEKGQLLSSSSEADFFHDAQEDKPPAAMILGVATLEVGVVLHSVIIGLTLASTADSEFATLFVVIVLHQMFEGLGLGTRLAFLQLPREYGWVPWAGAGAYALCTPVGLAIGLGVREGLVSLHSAFVLQRVSPCGS